MNTLWSSAFLSQQVPVLSAPTHQLSRIQTKTRKCFYEDLDSIIQTTLTSNKFVILGDFNTRMGANSGNWDGGLGQHWVGKLKGNNMLLLSTYAKYNLCNTNMMFRLAKKFRTTWMHPRSNTGIVFAMSQYVSWTLKMSPSPMTCKMLSFGQITGWAGQFSTYT